MERREAPGRIVHPGPAPGRDIGPVPVAIRHPARRHRRIPDLAVLRRRGPDADGGQLRPARHLRDHRRRRGGTDRNRSRLLARQHGGGKCVLRRRSDAALVRIGAGEGRGLARPNAQRQVRPADLRRAADHRHHRRVRRVTRDHVILPRRSDGHRPARRLQRDRLVRLQAAHLRVDLALRHGGSRAGIVERGQIELGRGVHRNHRAAQFEVRLSAGLGPERVAAHHRIVEARRAPVRVAWRVEGDGAGHERQPPDARRGIRRRLGVGRRRPGWRGRGLGPRALRQRGTGQQAAHRQEAGQSEQVALRAHGTGHLPRLTCPMSKQDCGASVAPSFLTSPALRGRGHGAQRRG